MPDDKRILVMGLGNRLLTDDAFGPLVIEALSQLDLPVDVSDGGTVGLSLLPQVQEAAAFIAVDAAEIGEAPGTIRTFVGAEMDKQLGGRKRSAHEVALFDLMATAELTASLPHKRALVAVQPSSTALGLEPTPAVAAAVGPACLAVRQLLEAWAP